MTRVVHHKLEGSNVFLLTNWNAFPGRDVTRFGLQSSAGVSVLLLSATVVVFIVNEHNITLPTATAVACWWGIYLAIEQ